MQEKPVLLIYAGPNGSGKSSLHKKFQKYYPGSQTSFLYINADDITQKKIGNQNINTVSKEFLNQINKEAAVEADCQREEAIQARISFATETVMSTPAKIDLMRKAKANGYEVHLFYMTTQDSTINVSRVKDRVEKGGHPVDSEKIKTRYDRAMHLLPEAIQAADSARIFNNSFELPVLILEKTLQNEIKLYPQNPPHVDSLWTIEKLEKIKLNVSQIDQCFQAIHQAQNIDKLGKSPTAEELYTAYANNILIKNQNVWYSQNQNTDKEIYNAPIG